MCPARSTIRHGQIVKFSHALPKDTAHRAAIQGRGKTTGAVRRGRAASSAGGYRPSLRLFTALPLVSGESQRGRRHEHRLSERPEWRADEVCRPLTPSSRDRRGQYAQHIELAHRRGCTCTGTRGADDAAA